jgi:hypothetical protein
METSNKNTDFRGEALVELTAVKAFVLIARAWAFQDFARDARKVPPGSGTGVEYWLIDRKFPVIFFAVFFDFSVLFLPLHRGSL